ncbi:phosphoglycerate mutase-like protein [Macrolepiota fuliginosa MF-IS2]|uniref:Phosphoglycerate mutase-like protein n=1 Tax=Macrolepiota fuliginosa MF-IS2 TaxID=1400762 RepID=A0A9P5X3U8_9AGAR|nr:phosphoglycerate mutase-like protein [Macrolepiota fuliginosa MF-IS2]
MTHTGGASERSFLLPTQFMQGDHDGRHQQRISEPKSTDPRSANYCTRDPDAAYPPIYTPITRRKLSNIRAHLLHGFLLLLVLLALLVFGYSIVTHRDVRANDPLRHVRSARPVDSDNYDSGASFAPSAIQKLWAVYAPYSSVEVYEPPPEDCRVTQVNILQRHGARYPMLKHSIRIAKALSRLQSAESFIDNRLRFITNYRYDLGVNDLIPFGESQSYESGRKSFARYSKLANGDNLPFVRASGSDRVVQSALKWIEGFATGSGGVLQPPLALILPQGGYNNTLEDKSCPNLDRPLGQVREWQSRYAQPIADRLNAAARGMPKNLTAEDAEALIELCTMETLAVEEYSRFCELFSKEEFEGFEYSVDLEKFYFTGHGSQLGPVEGVGYVNELLARLVGQPVQDRTQTNLTLDSNPETFPLGRGMYADFSHDNLIVAVVSAMGLFNNHRMGDTSNTGVLDPEKLDRSRAWFLSRIVPFSGRMVVERMECGIPFNDEAVGYDDSAGVKERQRRRAERNDSVYVRILMNDAV